MSNALPDGSRLEFGVATASYQIEGAPQADGKTPSIWDTLTPVPGAIDDGSDGSVACASYPDPGPDIDLVAGLGVRWYRFSLSWPRIVPDGGTEVNKLGLDYYERLVDGLLERGVTPMATLYHWDLPQSLEDRGGWLVRETAERFADYAMAVHDRLGDRVRLWATLNEPWCSAYLGYGSGRHAPGKQVGGEAHRAAHHLLLGHGLAAARMHEAGADGVGIVLNLTPVLPETEAAAEAADGVDAIRNRIWLARSSTGSTTPGPCASLPFSRTPTWSVPATSTSSAARPTGWASTTTPPRGWREATDELRDHRHRRATPTSPPFPGVEDFRFAPRHPRTDIDWEVDADSLERLLVDTHHRTGSAAGGHRERRGVRRHDAAARRQRRRRRPDRLPRARTWRPSTRPGRRGRRARLAGVDADGQLRVVPRLHQDVRAGQRRPRPRCVVRRSGPTTGSPT